MTLMLAHRSLWEAALNGEKTGSLVLDPGLLANVLFSQVSHLPELLTSDEYRMHQMFWALMLGAEEYDRFLWQSVTIDDLWIDPEKYINV